MAGVHEAIAAAQPDDECIVTADRRLTWADVTERTRRLATLLHRHGLGCHRERAELEPWESGQDHLGLYLHNGTEYLEAMLGAFKARVAPVQRQLPLRRRRAATTAARRPAARRSSSTRRSRRRSPRCSPTLPDARAAAPGARRLRPRACCPAPSGTRTRWRRLRPTPPPVTPSPDDLYILYTGGTTGLPEGRAVAPGRRLHRAASAGLARPTSLDDVVAGGDDRSSGRSSPRRSCTAPASWVSFNTWIDRRHRLPPGPPRAPRPGRHLARRRARAGHVPR